MRIHFTPPVKKTYIAAGKTGFRVFGDCKRGVYRVRIEAGARSVDGGVVTAPFSRSYSVAARKPQVHQRQTGLVGRGGGQRLGHGGRGAANLVTHPEHGFCQIVGDDRILIVDRSCEWESSRLG